MHHDLTVWIPEWIKSYKNWEKNLRRIVVTFFQPGDPMKKNHGYDPAPPDSKYVTPYVWDGADHSRLG
jgi:hypothetical protein